MLPQVQLLPHRMEQAVCSCLLQIPSSPLPHWPSLLLTLASELMWSLFLQVPWSLLLFSWCSLRQPCLLKAGDVASSLPGAKTAHLHILHGTGKPGDFLSCGHGSAAAGQAPWDVGYKVRSSPSFILFSFLWTCSWVKWSVDFNFCILNFKQGFTTPCK